MSAQMLSAQGFSKSGKLSISFRVLLSLYAIIPLCLGLYWLDSAFWHYALRDGLPSNPKQFLLFQILFGTPHIIASSILLVSNGDYLRLYQGKLVWMSLALAVFFGVGSLFISYRAFYILVAMWTVFHVLKQQLGVAQGVCRLPQKAFYLLVTLSVTAGCFIYLAIFLKNGLDAEQTVWVRHIAASLCALLVVSAVFCQRYVSGLLGKAFLWANVLLVVSSFYLYAQQYAFFAILMPRLVHDATAYIFYITHDVNKHAEKPQNALYRLASRCHIHNFLILPLLSFSLAFVLQAYGDAFFALISQSLFGATIPKVITVGLLGYLALMHYYTESFTWKGDSPYRRFIAFSK
ncbi:MAG: hypothetical protein WAX77_14280 [Methylococcaceae bacterium]